MSRLALQLLQSALGGLGLTVAAYLMTLSNSPAPAGVNPFVWGLIGVGLVRVAGFITGKLGPKPPPDTPASMRSARH